MKNFGDQDEHDNGLENELLFDYQKNRDFTIVESKSSFDLEDVRGIIYGG